MVKLVFLIYVLLIIKSLIDGYGWYLMFWVWEGDRFENLIYD